MGMGLFPSKKSATIYEIPIPSFHLVYVPLESLTKPTVRSVINVVIGSPSPNFDYSERTLLVFLLAINKNLEEIEKSVNNGNKIDEKLIQRVEEIRQWLVDRHNKQLDWNKLKELYAQIAEKKCTDMARYYGSKEADPYFELRMRTVSFFKLD